MRAIELTNVEQIEQIMLKKNIAKRMEQQERNQMIYLNCVESTEKAKAKRRDDLQKRYVKQKEAKDDQAAMRKSQRADTYKQTLQVALGEQKKAKAQQNLLLKKQQDLLDTQQMEYTNSKDN